MKTITIHGSKRAPKGTSTARGLRNKGFVPAVIYGRQEGKNLPLHFSLPIAEVRRITQAGSAFFSLAIGEEKYIAILQEKQLHPVSDAPLHLDLFAISPGQIIKMDIPIVLIGKSEGVLKGGLMVQKMRTIKVQAPMEKMPEKIEVDISHLDLAQTLRVREINAEGVTFLTGGSIPIASVQIPRSMRSSKSKETQQESPSA